MSSPSREALTRVARQLGPLANELVFVGGSVAELLVTAPAAVRVRPTDDADAVCEVASRTAYRRLGERLREAGFREDSTPGAPICRWRYEADLLDVMPVDGDLLGFRNAWYGHVVRDAVTFEIGPGVSIRMASAPSFLATKWDAFNDRGRGIWYGSHDLEDIITVVVGRPELMVELIAAPADIRGYVAEQTTKLLLSGVAADVVAGALPDARFLPQLLPDAVDRLEAISKLG